MFLILWEILNYQKLLSQHFYLFDLEKNAFQFWQITKSELKSRPKSVQFLIKIDLEILKKYQNNFKVRYLVQEWILENPTVHSTAIEVIAASSNAFAMWRRVRVRAHAHSFRAIQRPQRQPSCDWPGLKKGRLGRPWLFRGQLKKLLLHYNS